MTQPTATQANQRQKFRDEIRWHARRANVVIWHDQIIHSRHHAEICEVLSLEAPPTTFAVTEAESIEHALSLSEERFNATDAQRALAGAKLVKAGGVKCKVTEKAAAPVGSKTRAIA